MPNVTFYFEVHQPFRLKRVFSFGDTSDILDKERNSHIFNRVSDKCYLPMTKLLTDLVKKHSGFKVSFSFTGTFFEQAEMFRPEVINAFQSLYDTGGMDILSETYYHSLAFLIDKEEFKEQVSEHSDSIRRYFNYKPSIFRNTEAMYSNDIADTVAGMGYKGILAEGWEKYLSWRSPNHIYTPPSKNISVLLRNYRLSDDLAFRFSSHEWNQWPLTAGKYADWIANSGGDTVNLFMDYETFGEHQWKETGIFEFMSALPSALSSRGVGFNTITDTSKIKPVGVIDVPEVLSWADVDRDLSAWLGNKMQMEAFNKLKSMENALLKSKNRNLIRKWRVLQTSDNFYYMCTKWFADGDIHKYFNAYENPYLAYINYMNILSSLDRELKDIRPAQEQPHRHQDS
jgi:alpha-amylase